MSNFLSYQQLEEKIDYINSSPKNNGTLSLIVRRPNEDEREVLSEAKLTFADGLQGDNWKYRKSRHTPDGSPLPSMQLNLMNKRCIEVIAQSKEKWPLAGDQLFVDLDLSEDNLHPGDQLQIGSAIIQISKEPHNGCKKFAARFGTDSVKFINDKRGKHYHLRGLNAQVIKEGTITENDAIIKLDK